MIKAIMLAMIIMITSQVHADEWNKTQLALLAVAETSLFIDYRQTLDIKNHPGLYETNPILGKHPSNRRVHTYFAAAGLLTYVVADNIPSKYRDLFLVGLTSLQIIVIGNNKSLGIKMNF